MRSPDAEITREGATGIGPARQKRLPGSPELPQFEMFADDRQRAPNARLSSGTRSSRSHEKAPSFSGLRPKWP